MFLSLSLGLGEGLAPSLSLSLSGVISLSLLGGSLTSSGAIGWPLYSRSLSLSL